MTEKIKILFVEDSEDDQLLLTRQLEKAGLKPECVRVETVEALKKELADGGWDLVLADYNLPGFSGIEALKIIKSNGIEIPTILVSGQVGEEIAVKAMKAGADDFIVKNKLDRLVPAIERELEAAITRREKRETEKALKDSEKKYRAVVENSTEGIAVIQNSEFKFVNKRVCDVLGRPPSKLIGRSVFDFIHTDDRKTAAEQNRIRGGSRKITEPFIVRVMDKNNDTRWIENKVIKIDWQGNPATLIFMSDITERHLAKEEIERQHILLEKIIDNIPVMIGMYDEQANLQVINDQYVKHLGWTKEELNKEGIMNLCFPDPEYREKAWEFVQRATPNEWLDFDLQTKSGHKIPTCWTNVRLPDGLAIGIGIDLTQRKKMEEELEQSERRFRLFMENFPGAAYIKDEEGKAVFANEYTRDLLNGHAKNIIGLSNREIFPKNLADKFSKDDQKALSENRIIEVIDEIEHDGKTHYFLTLKFPLNIRHDRRLLGGISLDITQTKEYEKELKALTEELEEKRKNLERKNIALSEVLDRIERDKEEIKERFVTNIEEAILPAFMRLKDLVPKNAKKSIEAIEKDLDKITSPFLDNLKGKYPKLTNREIEICRLIKNGLTSKEIAESLNLSHMTIQKYRETIRKKFGFVHEKINLATYLQSLSDDTLK